MTTGPTPGQAHFGKLSAFAALWAALRRQRGPAAPGFWEQLTALPRLISQVLKGQYHGMDKSRLAMMVGALAYIISPIDLIPESLFLVLGLTDDAFVLSWLAGAILAETEAFLHWEAGESTEPPASQRVVPGEVI